MKILVVDLEFDYGKKSRGVNTIREYGYQAALTQLGHSVENFFYDTHLNNLTLLQEELLNAARTTQPDLIFFVLFQNQFQTQTLDLLKAEFKTMNWFGDDSWRFEDFTRHYAQHFSYCITTDKFSLAKYKKLGVKNVFLSQWAAIEQATPSTTEPGYQYDVSFVGAYNPYRGWFIDQLQKRGVATHCFGHGWPNGPVSNDEMMSVFRQSKINLNLSNSVNMDVRYLFSSIKSMAHCLRSKKVASQIKARNFEIPYHGGFQLTDYTPSLEDYFEIGAELACYNTVEDALTQIQFYLNNDSLREEVRERGTLKAKHHHGYSHRFREIFKGFSL